MIAGIILAMQLIAQEPIIEPCISTYEEAIDIQVASPCSAYDTNIDEEYIEYCIEYGLEYHITPSLFIAIIESESGGNPNAVAKSGSGAVGLCQLKPQYQYGRCEDLGITSLYNPENNIHVCADYLYELFRKYEDLGLVMTAYRYGEYSKEFKYAEATGYLYPYVEKVIRRSDDLQGYE